MGMDPLSIGLMIGGQVFSAIGERQAISAQESSARQAQEFKTRQTQLQVSRVQTQRAIEGEERERRLRVALASQRAQLGSAGVEIGSGSALRLQEATTGSINREQGLADFAAEQNILNLNIGDEQSKIGTQAELDALGRKKSGVLFDTVSSVGSTVFKNKDLL